MVSLQEATTNLEQTKGSLSDLRDKRSPLEKRKRDLRDKLENLPLDITLSEGLLKNEMDKTTEELEDVNKKIAEIVSQEQPLETRAGKFKNLILEYQAVEDVKAHNQNIFSVYKKMVEVNSLTTRLNVLYDQIQNLVRESPGIERNFTPSGVWHQAPAMLPSPFGTNRHFNRRFPVLEIINEDAFIKHEGGKKYE